jgi:hypothetical protein
MKDKIIYCVLIIWCIATVTWGLIKRNRRQENHIMTTARVVRCFRSGGKSSSHLYVSYYYYISGSKKLNSDNIIDEIREEMVNKYFVGKCFPVIYEVNDPSNSAILITPSDFESSNYDFPDSLTWVKNYIK